MANGKSEKEAAPVQVYDFYKTNGMPREAHEFHCVGPSMTRQEFAAECDINTIMAQYDKYLSDPMMSLRAAQAKYLNLDGMPETLMESMQILKDAEEAFYRLPAVVRREFENNPVAFTDYALDPNNLDQMREWGLAKPKAEEPKPMKVEVVAPGAAAAAPGASSPSPGSSSPAEPASGGKAP